MNKKYHIFISSTFEDLKEERKKIIKTLWNNQYIPIGMEFFGASSKQSLDIIKSTLDSCDYIILIIAKKYGTIHKDYGKSFTELEYEYAKTKGIPVLPFIISPSKKYLSNKIEKQKHRITLLENFINTIKESQQMAYWSSKTDLAEKVIFSLNNEIKKNPRPGYTRSNSTLSINHYISHDATKYYKDIKRTKKYIIFHAAFYPKYLADRNPYQESIENALINNKDLNIYIIVTDYNATWFDEFAKVLRNSYDKKSYLLKNAIEANIESVKELKKRFPHQIHLLESNNLPFSPMIITDDTILVGSYMHSCIPAPDGLWLKIKNKEIINWIETLLREQSPINNINNENKAYYRYIEECINTIKSSKEIL